MSKTTTGYTRLSPVMKQAIADHYHTNRPKTTLAKTADAFNVSATTVWKVKNEYPIQIVKEVKPKHQWVFKFFGRTITITIN